MAGGCVSLGAVSLNWAGLQRTRITPQVARGENQTVIWLSQDISRALHMCREKNIFLPRQSAVTKSPPHTRSNNIMKFLQGASMHQPHVRSGVIQCNQTQPRALQPSAYRSYSTWKCGEPEYQHISGQAFSGRLCSGDLLARPWCQSATTATNADSL